MYYYIYWFSFILFILLIIATIKYSMLSIVNRERIQELKAKFKRWF